jgi:hypothetical protein
MKKPAAKNAASAAAESEGVAGEIGWRQKASWRKKALKAALRGETGETAAAKSSEGGHRKSAKKIGEAASSGGGQ